jgi:hypothetical protein
MTMAAFLSEFGFIGLMDFLDFIFGEQSHQSKKSSWYNFATSCGKNETLL